MQVTILHFLPLIVLTIINNNNNNTTTTNNNNNINNDNDIQLMVSQVGAGQVLSLQSVLCLYPCMSSNAANLVESAAMYACLVLCMPSDA